MKDKAAINALTTQLRLLQIEYEEEKASFTKIKEKEGLEKQRARGNAWLGIKIGRSFYNSLNQRVIEIYRNPDEEDDHNFEYGKPVMFFTFGAGFDSSFKSLFASSMYLSSSCFD